MDIFDLLAGLNRSGKAFMLATIIRASGSSPAKAGFRMVVENGGSNSGTIGGGALEKIVIDEALSVFKTGIMLPEAETRMFNLAALGMECGGQVELLIEYFGGRKSFVLFGGGHVGQALAPILEIIGYRVTVLDNRPEIKPLITGGSRNVITADYSDISVIADTLKSSGGCFIATHGHEHDQKVLEQILKLAPGLPYIGMIGSKNKVGSILKRIRESGTEIPDTLFSPVGLKIGGDSAGEIAVSIAAEFVAVNNNASVSHMR
jgi:xanthine dehydrogenase accessory factor